MVEDKSPWTFPPVCDTLRTAYRLRRAWGRKPRPTVCPDRSLSGETDVFRGSVNIPFARRPHHAAARPGLSGRDRCQRARHSGAAAHCADGSAAVGQCGHRRDHAADDDLRPHAAGIQYLSLLIAGHHALPPRAQRGHDAIDPHPGDGRWAVRGRRRGEDVRRIRHGRIDGHRQDRRRSDHLCHHCHHSVRGDHEGRHANQRSGRPLRLGRHAGSADGHRRRHERGDHRRARGPAPPQGNWPAGRLLRGHGRCQQVRPRRCHRRYYHHPDQHCRRAVHRHDRVGHEPRPGRLALHHAHHRRRPGEPGPGLPDLVGGRPAGDPQQQRQRPAATNSCSNCFLVPRPWPWRAGSSRS